jgi:pyruvate dehydrogenase E2 component (dihydrolipoamide acetyltransferase)
MSMPSLLRAPEVTTSSAGAVLQSWSVGAGTAFAAGDVLATIETEKAVVEVEADRAGVLLRTLVPEGVTVAVGDPIALLGEPGERPDDLDAVLTGLGARPEPPPEPPAAVVEVVEAPVPAVVERVFASPLARRLAKQAGLRVEELTGTGPDGRIIRRDVEAAARTAAPAPTPAAPPPPARPAEVTPPPTAAPVPGPDVVEIPHTPLRRAIAQRLTASTRDTPHFYLRGAARVDALLDLRRRLNESAAVRVSVNDLVVRAAALAHAKVPAMNVTWAEHAVRSYPTVDLSVAVSTERGLVTPVLRGVDRLSVTAVARQVQDFTARAASGRLRQDELEGGTLTVTNLGMYGVGEFAAIINPPQSAILAVGAAVEEPVVRDGRIEVGTVMRVTLSVDHRPLDGVVAAGWLRELVALLEDPLRILA